MLVARAALVLGAVAAPCGTHAQQARGIVFDLTTRLPIPEATVTLLDSGALELGSARTDSAGVFTILAPMAAQYLVTVRRLGYHGFNSGEITLGHRDTTLIVALTPSPQRLPPSVTRANRGFFAREWGRDGFMKRRELGAGVFLTRTDLLLKEPLSVEDMLRNVDGLMVRNQGLGQQVWAYRGSGCLRTLLNRLPYRSTAYQQLLPEHVLGVEIYPQFKDVPEELRLDTDGCGLILMWTRAAWAPRAPKVDMSR